MSELTAKDMEYRRAGVMHSWNVHRRTKGDPSITIHRYAYVGGRPDVGLPHLKNYAPGFPFVIPCDYVSASSSDIPSRSGLFAPNSVVISIFSMPDFVLSEKDEIEFLGNLFRISQIEAENGIGLLKFVISPAEAE